MLVSLLALFLGAQAPDVQQLTLKSGVEVRTMTITVHGRAGGQPKLLAQEDFTVFENGLRQPISLFVKNTDDPKAPRYQLGYAVQPCPPGQKKRIEIRIRGFRKKMYYDFVTR
jgi:hypothetical protein